MVMMTREANVYNPLFDGRLGYEHYTWARPGMGADPGRPAVKVPVRATPGYNWMLVPAKWAKGQWEAFWALSYTEKVALMKRYPVLKTAKEPAGPALDPEPKPLFKAESKSAFSQFISDYGAWIGAGAGALVLVGMLRPRRNPPRHHRRSRR